MVVTWHIRFVSIKLSNITRISDPICRSALMPSQGAHHESDDAETSISKATTVADSTRSSLDLEKLVAERVKKLLGQQPQNSDALSEGGSSRTIGK